MFYFSFDKSRGGGFGQSDVRMLKPLTEVLA